MNGLTRRPADGGSRKTRTLIGEAGAFGLPLEPRLMMAADVLTYHNDNMRDGANLKETALTPANVNMNTFGALGQVAVDGQVYAQTLVKTNVKVPGKGVHNVVYVATEHDSVYAFDANTLKPLWQKSLVDPAKGVNVLPAANVGIYPELGVTSTPVIDPTTNTMYVLANVTVTKPYGISIEQQLHAIDLGTGRDKFGGPVTLSGIAPGNGLGSVNGQTAYITEVENQRSALLLSKGVVYIASASYGDVGPYHGWVLGYNAHTLKQVSAYNDTPNGKWGGIWMSGGGPAADAAGNIYLTTSNGTFQPTGPNGGNYGDSVVKLSNAGSTATDYFTPADQGSLEAGDLDFGSGGIMLLPDQAGPNTHLAVTAGKEGTLYLLNRDNLGKFNPGGDQVVQSLDGAIPYSFDTPAYWNGHVYFGGGLAQDDPTQTPFRASLQAFSLVNGKLDPTPVSAPGTYDWPGGNPVVSANGSKDGIVWAISGTDRSGNAVTLGTLHAYNASNISQELYNSAQAGTRDAGGVYVKFTSPTVANGHVYVAGKKTLTMYGLLHPTASKARPARGY